MSRHSLAAKVAGVAVAAATAVVVAAGTASADIWSVTTSDADPGGIAYFNSGLWRLSAVDLEADGYAVWAQSWLEDSAGNHYYITTVHTVGSASAGADTPAFQSGTDVHFIACLRKGTDPVTYCKSRVVTIP